MDEENTSSTPSKMDEENTSSSSPSINNTDAGDVEWIDVSVAQDKGVQKKIVQAALEGARGPPPHGNEVTAHYTGTLESDGTKFDSSVDRGTPFKFTIGTGQVIKGWDEGFASMKIGEKAILKVSSDYGYGPRGSPPKIPGGATLLFEVELLSFKEKAKKKWELTDEERADLAKKLKTEGTDYFQKQQYADAIEKYNEAADICVGEGIQDNDISDQERPMYVSCWSNIAMCHVKQKAWSDAIAACNRILQLDDEKDTNVKALYRRGLARTHIGLLVEAKTDLMAAYNLDKKNKDVLKALQQLKDAMAESKRKEKAAFGGMFEKGGVDIYGEKEGVFVPNAKGDNPHVYCKYY
jgi:peptidylprolyl isomerase